MAVGHKTRAHTACLRHVTDGAQCMPGLCGRRTIFIVRRGTSALAKRGVRPHRPNKSPTMGLRDAVMGANLLVTLGLVALVFARAVDQVRGGATPSRARALGDCPDPTRAGHVLSPIDQLWLL